MGPGEGGEGGEGRAREEVCEDVGAEQGKDEEGGRETDEEGGSSLEDFPGVLSPFATPSEGPDTTPRDGAQESHPWLSSTEAATSDPPLPSSPGEAGGGRPTTCEPPEASDVTMDEVDDHQSGQGDEPGSGAGGDGGASGEAQPPCEGLQGRDSDDDSPPACPTEGALESSAPVGMDSPAASMREGPSNGQTPGEEAEALCEDVSWVEDADLMGEPEEPPGGEKEGAEGEDTSGRVEATRPLEESGVPSEEGETCEQRFT
jgi:hypothetical protein